MSRILSVSPGSLRSLRRSAARLYEAQQRAAEAIRAEINRRVSDSLPTEQEEVVRRVWARWEAAGRPSGAALDTRQLREDEGGNIYDRISGALIVSSAEAPLLTAALMARQEAFDANGVG